VGRHHPLGFIEEQRLSQSLTAAVDLIQPWGELDVGISGSHYLHDLDRWRIELDGRFEVRLFQGFFVNLGLNYQWIRDQLHIPAEDLTEEEILLELQQLATNSRYQTLLRNQLPLRVDLLGGVESALRRGG